MEDEENQGSLLLGALLGYFLGCVGVIIAVVLQGPKTLTGSVIGMVLQWVSIMCLGVIGMVFNMMFLGAN